MKTANFNLDGTLAHSTDCEMAFGRKDHECPRCIELLNGAAPRAGWQKDYYAKKAREEKATQHEIENHFKTCPICSGREPGVCTFGQW